MGGGGGETCFFFFLAEFSVASLPWTVCGSRLTVQPAWRPGSDEPLETAGRTQKVTRNQINTRKTKKGMGGWEDATGNCVSAHLPNTFTLGLLNCIRSGGTLPQGRQRKGSGGKGRLS